MYYIYTITNQKNGKMYVGFTSNPTIRWSGHKSQAKTVNRPLYNSMRHHGIENFKFEVIYESEDREKTLLEMEPYFIRLYDTYNSGYNCNYGGSNTNTDEMRENTRQRMLKHNPMWGATENAGWFRKGHVPTITEERNEKIRQSKSGQRNHNFGNSDAAAHLNQTRVECEHCHKTTNKGNYSRWHGAKCSSRV